MQNSGQDEVVKVKIGKTNIVRYKEKDRIQVLLGFIVRAPGGVQAYHRSTYLPPNLI